MAKVAFSKLKCKVDDSVKEIQINDEIVIEVKQYLPIQEKLGLIGRIVELAHEQDQNYSNPVKAEVYRDLEVLFAYTNITFTDKQKEDTAKLYDLLFSSGILTQVIQAIPEEEYNHVCRGVYQSIDAIYTYQNSVLGILDTIKADYSSLDLDVEKIREKLVSQPEELSLLKEILTNLG